jgi:hypothetical protein
MDGWLWKNPFQWDGCTLYVGKFLATYFRTWIFSLDLNAALKIMREATHMQEFAQFI